MDLVTNDTQADYGKSQNGCVLNYDQMKDSHLSVGIFIDLSIDALPEIEGRGKLLMYDNIKAAIEICGYKPAWKEERFAYLDAAFIKDEATAMVERLFKELDALPFSDIRIEKDEANNCVIRTIGKFMPTDVKGDM